MKISYIIPVYNIEKYLRQCVDSVLAQSLDDCEIILIDDGSEDGCPAICDSYAENYPDKIKVIHKENGGPAVARNLGIDCAKGEFLFFIDSDDYLKDDKVGELYKIAKDNSADVLQTSYYSLNEKNGEITVSSIPFDNETALSHEEMEREICSECKNRLIVFAWKNLYRREFLINNSIYFDESLKMIEDPPFNMQAYCAAEKFIAVDIPVYCYRVRSGSLQRQKYISDYDLILQKQWKLKIKYYEQYCKTDKMFYDDLAEYTVRVMFPSLLSNIYRNRVPDRLALIKRIGESEMLRRSFDDYDIERFKSKSLDWVMTKAIKNHNYLLADFICRKILYK